MSEVAILKQKISDLELHVKQLQRDLMQSEKARTDLFNELSKLKGSKRCDFIHQMMGLRCVLENGHESIHCFAGDGR